MFKLVIDVLVSLYLYEGHIQILHQEFFAIFGTICCIRIKISFDAQVGIPKLFNLGRLEFIHRRLEVIKFEPLKVLVYFDIHVTKSMNLIICCNVNTSSVRQTTHVELKL